MSESSAEVEILDEARAKILLDEYRTYKKSNIYFSNPDYYKNVVWLACGLSWLGLTIVGILLAAWGYAKMKLFSDFVFDFAFWFCTGAIIFIVGSVVSKNENDDAVKDLTKMFVEKRIAEIIANFPQLLSNEVKEKIGYVDGEPFTLGTYDQIEQIYWKV